MRQFTLLFTKEANAAYDDVVADRYEIKDDFVFFYNEGGQIVAQYEKKHVVGIRQERPTGYGE